MLRVGLAALLWLEPAAEQAPAEASEQTAPDELDAEAHIAAGEDALSEGRPADAAEHFSRAYGQLEPKQRAGDLGSLILSETVKARLAAWRSSTELDQLLSARDMLRNHAMLVEEDGGDAAEFFEQMVQIDGMITRAREAAPKPPPPEATPPPPEPKQAPPRLPSQRRRYVAGLTATGVGAATAVVGLVVGVFYGVRGREFSQSLARDDTAYQDSGCATSPESLECVQLESNVEFWRQQGRRANTIAILGGGLTGGVGLVSMAIGLGVAFTTDPDRRYSASAQGLRIRF